VLPGALRRTLGLTAGVGVLSLLIGTGTAWLVTMYRFPGRRVLQWLLLLPLAVPTYIIAYSYLELLDYSGIVQTSLRELFGWQNARSYWFPDIRSLRGAIFVMSAVSLRARGEPYVGPDRLPDLLASRLAAGQASACRRRGACTDGDAK
jgi:iron(III) transport system permease protein